MKKIFLESDIRNPKRIVVYREFVGRSFFKKNNYIKHIKITNGITHLKEKEKVNLQVIKWKGNIAIVNVVGVI